MKDFTNKDLIHVKDGDTEYIKFRILDKYSDKLKHCCTLKHGGVSTGYYSSLNLDTSLLNNGDKKDNLINNTKIICDELNIKIEDLCTAIQAHTDDLLVLDNNNKEIYKYMNFSKDVYDGYITKEKNIASVVRTADCNPVIIYDSVKNAVANVHSGWLGTTKRIYINAVKIMHDKYDCNYEDLIVCIGPSINKCCWKSRDQKLKEQFINIWPYENEYIENKEDGEFSVDFPYVIKKDLMKMGIKEHSIVLSNICTYCNNDNFFSYRYATHKTDKICGRQGTIVELI